MANSLLAHLYTHIKGSQEDIATISLQYILSQSAELNRAFNKRLATLLEVDFDENLQYICHLTGKNNEIPDMAGIDCDGKEKILCEMKFYAGLTANQPLTYLERLKNELGKGLVFICPGARLISLWTKLKECCSERGFEKVSEFCLCVDGIHLAIIAWSNILELLTQIASSVSVNSLSDIKQLEGYCAQMDSDAFIPFSGDDLSAEIAKKAERYYRVIDEAIHLLCDDETLKTSLHRLKATAYRNGYTRSLYLDEFTISLNYDRVLWKSTASIETPFWVSIRNSSWKQTEEILNAFQHIPQVKKETQLWNMLFLALEPLPNATLSEVCYDIKQQILDYITLIRKSSLSE